MKFITLKLLALGVVVGVGLPVLVVNAHYLTLDAPYRGVGYTLIIVVSAGVAAGLLAGLAARGGLAVAKAIRPAGERTSPAPLVLGSVLGATFVGTPLLGIPLALLAWMPHPLVAFALVAAAFAAAFGVATYLWVRPWATQASPTLP